MSDLRLGPLLLRENTIDLAHRDAIPRPRTFDAEALTIEAVIASTTPVRRRDTRGDFMEVLDPAGLDLGVTRGASVLNSHNQSGLDNILGTIDDVRIEGAEVIARIRFSPRPEVASIVADVRSGIIQFLSVGYQVDKWIDTKAADGTRTRTAAKWSVREASFVSVPADPTARTRSTPEIGSTGPDREFTTRTIHELARRAGVPVARADALIELNATVEDARRAFLSDIIDRNVTVRSGRDHTMQTIDNPEVMQRAMSEALYVRIAPSFKPDDIARQFVGLSIPELAREVLKRNSIQTTGMNASDLIQRALHSTSDFPLILANTVGRTLRASYQAAPSGIRQLAREQSAPDFRARSRLMLDASGFTLEKVLETGEFKLGSMTEAGESYAIDSYGKIFGISRKALINDDVGAFSDLSRRLGQAAAVFEIQFLVDMLTSQAGLGPTMSDGAKLFDATHNNVGIGGIPSETSLSAARIAMRKQTGPDGGQISVTPKYLFVPAELETTGQKLITTIQPVMIADVNVFDNLTLVVEPRLKNATRWYLVGDPAEIDGLEYCYLAGAPGPQCESKAGFEVDGVQIKIRLDYGGGFVDWRGWQTNAGV
jgi:phage head maturation protease